MSLVACGWRCSQPALPHAAAADTSTISSAAASAEPGGITVSGSNLLSAQQLTVKTATRTVRYYNPASLRAGNFVWATKAGGTQQDKSHSVQLRSDGTIFVAGYAGSPSAVFGPLAYPTVSSANFIAKLDANGQWAWALRAGGSTSINTVVNATSNKIRLSMYGGSSVSIFPFTTSTQQVLVVQLDDN